MPLAAKRAPRGQSSLRKAVPEVEEEPDQEHRRSEGTEDEGQYDDHHGHGSQHVVHLKIGRCLRGAGLSWGCEAAVIAPSAPSFKPPDIDVVEVEAVPADRKQVVGPERRDDVFPAGRSGNAGYQHALGIKDLPPVAGRAHDFDPELAIRSDKEILDVRSRVRPRGFPGIARGALPVGRPRIGQGLWSDRDDQIEAGRRRRAGVGDGGDSVVIDDEVGDGRIFPGAGGENGREGGDRSRGRCSPGFCCSS